MFLYSQACTVWKPVFVYHSDKYTFTGSSSSLRKSCWRGCPVTEILMHFGVQLQNISFFINPCQIPRRTLSMVKWSNWTLNKDIVRQFSKTPPSKSCSVSLGNSNLKHWSLAKWHMYNFAPLKWQNGDTRQATQTLSCFWYTILYQFSNWGTTDNTPILNPQR